MKVFFINCLSIKFNSISFFLPVQYFSYQGDYDKCQSAQRVQQCSKHDVPCRQSFYVPEAGMMIAFCVFCADRWRHMVNIMPPGGSFGKPVIKFHSVVPAAVNKCDLQWRQNKRKYQQPEEKYFLQTAKKIKSACGPQRNQWKQYKMMIFMEQTENFQILWNHHGTPQPFPAGVCSCGVENMRSTVAIRAI